MRETRHTPSALSGWGGREGGGRGRSGKGCRGRRPVAVDEIGRGPVFRRGGRMEHRDRRSDYLGLLVIRHARYCHVVGHEGARSRRWGDGRSHRPRPRGFGPACGRPNIRHEAWRGWWRSLGQHGHRAICALYPLTTAAWLGFKRTYSIILCGMTCYFRSSIRSRSSSYSKNARYIRVTQTNLLAQSATLAFLKLLFEEYKEGNLGHLRYRRFKDGSMPRYRAFLYILSGACLNRKYISRGARWSIQGSQLSRYMPPKHFACQRCIEIMMEGNRNP